MKHSILIAGLLSYESPKYWGLCNKSIENTISSDTSVSYLIGLDRVPKNEVQELKTYLPNLTTFDTSIEPSNVKKGKEDKTAKRIRIGQLYNNLFARIPKETQYAFILDGDIAFVKKNWDLDLLGCLNDNCVVVGHEYSDRWPGKYQNFPCVQCSLFNYQKIKDLKIDFCGTSKDLKIETKDQSTIFGIPVGQKLNRDIGWEWPLKIKQSGFSAKTMKFVPGDHASASFLKPVSKQDFDIYKINHKDGIKSLFEFYLDGQLIGTHLTKSTCLRYDIHPISKFWIERVQKTFL